MNKNINILDFIDLISDLILITNYDLIITKYLSSHKKQFSMPKNLRTIENFKDLMSNSQQKVIHLRGNYEELESMSVTEEDYERLYSDAKIQHILYAIMGDNPILFIGLSFKDECFKRLFSSKAKQIGGTHFIIVPNLHPFDADEFFSSNLVPIGIRVNENYSDYVKALKVLVNQISYKF